MINRSNSNFDHIEGAPVEVRARVLVSCAADETGNRANIGREGTVEYLEYECGCGQSYPDDPMIGVRFDDGVVEEYWQEELVILGSRSPFRYRGHKRKPEAKCS